MATGLICVNLVAENLRNLLLAGKRFFLMPGNLEGALAQKRPGEASARPHAGFPTGGKGGFDTAG